MQGCIQTTITVNRMKGGNFGESLRGWLRISRDVYARKGKGEAGWENNRFI